MGKLKIYKVQLKTRYNRKIFVFLPGQEQAGCSLDGLELKPSKKAKRIFKKYSMAEEGKIWACCKIRRSANWCSPVLYADTLFEPGDVFSSNG